MADVKKNIAANLIGNIWQTLVGLALVPVYIKFMGVEAYGLVGIFISLQILAGMLDMGLNSTINREMARRSVLPGGGDEIRNLTRSLEIIYWSIAVVIGVIIVFVSPLIAQYWIKGNSLSQQTIAQAVLIMGLIMIIQWPASLYANGLYGLQRHVPLNAINIFMVTLRGIGAVLVLWLVSPTIQAFFIWQIFVSAAHTALLVFYLWQNLPSGGNKPVFQIHLLKSVGRFAAGVASVTILSIILTQMDKVILSKMLSLEEFGYYTVAGIVAMSPLRIAFPVFAGIYPKFTQIVSLADYECLERTYHKACQLMAALIAPFSVIVAFFSYDLIALWTQNPTIAENTYLLASILICGTVFHSFLLAPHALQLSFGWTRLLFFKNLVAVVALAPLIIYMTHIYGATGAAWGWLFLNLGSVLIEIPIMHRRLLSKSMWKWYAQDVFVPLVTASLIAGIGKILMPPEISTWIMIAYLLFVSAATMAATAMITPATREWLLAQLLKTRERYAK